MNENRTIQGLWFLPREVDKTVAGVFTYNRIDGCSLELVNNRKSNVLVDSKVDIILGIAKDGTSITLLDCSRSSGHSNIKGVQIVKYRAQFAFLGQHYNSEGEIVFDKLKASITDLGMWVGVYGFNRLDVQSRKFAIDLNYQLPDNINFEITKDLKAEFEFDVSYTWIKETEDAEIHQKVFATICTTNFTGFRDMLSNFYTLYKFFSLAYYEAPPLLSLYFQHSGMKHEWNEDYPLQVELLYHDNFYNAKYKKEKNPFDFLFGYNDIKEIFPKVLSQWFHLFEKLAPSVNLLNELLMKRGLTVEIQFLSAIQAVETFHRNIFGGEDIPKDLHQNRIKVILESVPEEFNTWLKEKLSFSNEPTLRKRLNDIYERIPAEIVRQLINDKTNFIKDVVNTRNYYTHYSSTLKKKIMDFKGIFGAVQKLKIILICSILNEIGFNTEQISNAIKMHIVYPYYEY